jgi:hypothetical protein
LNQIEIISATELELKVSVDVPCTQIKTERVAWIHRGVDTVDPGRQSEERSDIRIESSV